jgi:hypothetical protein
MNDNAFIEKKKKPDASMIEEALGESYALLKQFFDQLNQEYNFLNDEWKFYGSKYGWSQKVYLKKRNLFFFSAAKDYFTIAFVFGDRGVQAVEKSDLPPVLINELVNANKYAEGRGLKIPVKNISDVEIVLKLVKIKVEN